MNEILNERTTSIYTFCETVKEADRLLEEHGSDEDAIQHELETKYPEDKYFLLIDYIDDRNQGYFHIRVWEK